VKTLAEQVIGAWNLVSFEQESEDGILTFPLGKTAKGAIYYLPTGHVSVHIMQPGRSEAIDPLLYTGKSLNYQGLGYLAYCGRYHVDEEKQIMTHELEIILYPEWVGGQQIRFIQLHEDQLQLSSIAPVGPQKIQFRLLWERSN
jgi:hypothetical protein